MDAKRILRYLRDLSANNTIEIGFRNINKNIMFAGRILRKE